MIIININEYLSLSIMLPVSVQDQFFNLFHEPFRIKILTISIYSPAALQMMMSSEKQEPNRFCCQQPLQKSLSILRYLLSLLSLLCSILGRSIREHLWISGIPGPQPTTLPPPPPADLCHPHEQQQSRRSEALKHLLKNGLSAEEISSNNHFLNLKMSNIVRQSKFRHVFCKPIKQDQCIQDVRITEVSWDSQFCAVNPKFIAIINKGSGGPFLVLPVNKFGRIDKETPFVDAHRAACLEVHWSPFNDHVIASCSEDTTAKVWLIPEHGLLRNLSEPVVELCGHQKRVNTLAWHPTAANILITAGGENKLLVWNVGTGEALMEIAGHPDQIFSINFNYDGSRFVTTCKDRMIRVLDSHTGDVLSSGMGHEGVKPQRAIFLKDGRILTTGFSKRSERLYALRDPSNMQPILQEELDTSNGVLFPLYDEDSGLCYLVGKGDCAIRYYEINDDPPFMHYINTYTTSEPQRGFAFMPKRGLNSNENEINRIYKITTKGVVDILQFFVPRKSDLWQADLYPDTRSMVPALTAEQFMEGKNAPPNLMPVNPEAAKAKPKVQVAKKANILAQMPVQEAYSEPPQQQRAPPPQQTPSPQKPVRHDDDMGIVRQQPPRPEPSPPAERPNPMVPKSQVQLKARESRDEPDGAQTAGQRRAAAELNRIRREQTRGSDTDANAAPSVSATPSISRRGSNASSVATGGSSEELEKIKAVLRQHERRIRLLEDMLADANMSNAYGI